MLRVDGLIKCYGSLLALDDVSFEVARGQVVGFLGPNGAGKTTAMRAIMRLVSLEGGDASWDGVPITPAIRQGFGYMPAERGMYPRMKVRDHLVYYARLSGRRGAAAERAVDEWLERLGLADRGADPVQSLSSGNQQRVQLALALLNEPELLVLDEPFSGLDPIAVEMLNEVLREQVDRGAALLLSSHQLDLVAEVCSAVVIVDHGRVVLRGDVARIRAASTTRHIDIEFATPTTWAPAGDVTVSGDGRRHRLTVDAGTDAQGLIADAQARGEVMGYSFTPPGLSEVFLAAVGRDAIDEPGHEAPAGAGS